MKFEDESENELNQDLAKENILTPQSIKNEVEQKPQAPLPPKMPAYDYSQEEEERFIGEVRTIFKGTKETLAEAFELEDLDSVGYVTPEGL